MSDDTLPEIELTLEQAAMLFQTALSVIVRMEEEEFDQRPSSAAIPRARCVAPACCGVPQILHLDYADII